MKRLLYVSCFLALINNFFSLPLFAMDGPNSAEQLRDGLKSALDTKDTNAVISLFNSEFKPSESNESKAMQKLLILRQMDAILRTTDASVELVPMSAGFPIPNTNRLNGICTKFNVVVDGMLEVKTQHEIVQELPYGRSGDRFYIAGITQEKIPGISLDVNILAGPNTDILTFTGRWTYVVSGQIVSVQFSDKTNRFESRWGDYIKSCEVRRTSTSRVDGFDNWFYFQIHEGGTNVFESPGLTNEDLFTYQRK